MVLTISLPSEAEAKLKERAQAAGQELGQYVQQIITRELVAPVSLVEAAEPIARAVDAARVTDDEFLATLNDAHEAARRARKNGP